MHRITRCSSLVGAKDHTGVMTDTITLTGLVATIPKQISSGSGTPHISFRLASNQRRFDRKTASWIEGETNWYTINAFRQLAVNLTESLEKGQRVVVSGRVRIRDWATSDKSGTNIDIDAEAIGHDLRWGTAKYLRGTIASGIFAPDHNTIIQSTESVETLSQAAPADYSTQFPIAVSDEQQSWPEVPPGASLGARGQVSSGDLRENEVPF